MGQGQVRGERMTLVAIVHWKDEDRIVNSLIKAVDRVRARHPVKIKVNLGSLTKFLPESSYKVWWRHVSDAGDILPCDVLLLTTKELSLLSHLFWFVQLFFPVGV